MRQLVEAWHGIPMSDGRAEALAQVDAKSARSVASAAESLTLRDQPSRFRAVLASVDERLDRDP